MGKTLFVDLSGKDMGGLLNKVLYTELRREVKPFNTTLPPPRGGGGVRKLWIFVFDAVTGSGS